MNRHLAVLAAATVGVSLLATTASAAPGDTAVFRFSGRAGSAVLTDCPVGAPVGTTCRAVSVFAGEERINNDGERMSGPFVAVSLFEVVITDTEPFFEAVEIGFGATDDADVNISPALARGSASADDVALCEEFDCPPGAPQTLSIEVDWDAFGPRQTFRSRQTITDPFCATKELSRGAIRDADATGLLDGDPVVEPEAPGFQATLQSDKFGSIQRCSAP